MDAALDFIGHLVLVIVGWNIGTWLYAVAVGWVKRRFSR